VHRFRLDHVLLPRLWMTRSDVTSTMWLLWILRESVPEDAHCGMESQGVQFCTDRTYVFLHPID
jgi:hypothetical protein